MNSRYAPDEGLIMDIQYLRDWRASAHTKLGGGGCYEDTGPLKNILFS